MYQIIIETQQVKQVSFKTEMTEKTVGSDCLLTILWGTEGEEKRSYVIVLLMFGPIFQLTRLWQD